MKRCVRSGFNARVRARAAAQTADRLHGDAVGNQKFGGEPRVVTYGTDQRFFDPAETFRNDLRPIEQHTPRIRVFVARGLLHGQSVEFPVKKQYYAVVLVFVYHAGGHYPKFLLTLDEDPSDDFDGIRKLNALDWLLQ